MAIVIIALSIFLSPWFWWSFILLTAWAAWKLRSIPDKSAEMFDQIPARLTDRVDRLGYLHDLRTEILRANIAITPGIERYLLEKWEYEHLRPGDQRAIDAGDAALRERVAAGDTFSWPNQDSKN